MQDALYENPPKNRASSISEVLPSFTKDDFVIVASKEFWGRKNLSLFSHSPRLFFRAGNDYVYSVEDLWNGSADDMRLSRFKFYSNGSSDRELVESHLLQARNIMVI